VSIPDYELCDYNAPANQEVFDLNTMIPQITSSPSGVTITFYDNLADAQNPTPADELPNFYSNTSNPQQIWFNIKDNVTGCSTTGSFNLVVNPLPVIVTPPTIFECSNGLTLTAIFDLTINERTVTNNVPGLSVTYYNNLLDAQNGNTAVSINDPVHYPGTDNETVYIRIENDATGCYNLTTQLLRVTQGPLAMTPQPMQYCDPNNDGFGEFDLNTIINEIAGTPVPSGVSVSFHETPDDANIGATPIDLTVPYHNIRAWSQIIYARVYYTLTGCANIVPVKLNVNPTPEAVTPSEYALCDESGLPLMEPFDLNSRIPEILGGINPATVTVSFYEDLTDAQVPQNAIGSPFNYVSATRTVYVRVEFIATGCYDIVELHLVVNPLPNSLQPNYPPVSQCDNNPLDVGREEFDLGSMVNGILLGQSGMDVSFHYSLGDAQNNTRILPLLYVNEDPFVQTIGIRITNRATGCYVISTMDLRVEPLPTLIPQSSPYTICDGDQDGLTCGFDLTTLVNDLLQGANYSLSFYETQTDAQTGSPVTAINTSQPYCNINPYMQLLYVRAVDNITGCVSVTPIELNVDPSPVAPVNLSNIQACDYDSNPNGETIVDLTQNEASILAQQAPPAADYEVSYYTSQSDAQNANSTGLQIIPADSHYGRDGDTIWVRVENIHTHCFNIGSFQLDIDTPMQLSTPTPLSLCDDDALPNDQHHAFDLTIRDAMILSGRTGTVAYYPSYGEAQTRSNEISTANGMDPHAYVNVPPAVQTLGVVVTTPEGCQSLTTLDIRVLPIPVPRTNPPALAPKCDDVNPGNMTEIFDLTVNESYIANGDGTLTFHYFPSQADAENNNTSVEYNPANAAEVGHNVWIRVENNRVDYQGNHCYVIVEQALTVNPLPTVIQPLAPFRACDDNADGITVFDFGDPLLAPQILGTSTTGQQPSDYTISYYATAAGANPSTNTGEAPLPSIYTSGNQTVYIRVENTTTGCVNATGTLDLVVEDYAVANPVTPYHECDSDTPGNPFDGVDTLDLEALFASEVLGSQNPAVFLLSYYTVDPVLNPGAVALTPSEYQNYTTDPDTDTIWIKVENSSNSIMPFCSAVTPVSITIERKPHPQISGANGATSICVDFITNQVIRPLVLDSGISNPSDYTFEWYEASDPSTILGTGPGFTVDTAVAGGADRDYYVHVTNNFTGTRGCDWTSDPFTVHQSGPAVVPAGTLGYTVSNAFGNPQSITVNVVGYGTYEYNLDEGPRQSDNVFTNVSIDPHIIYVWDVTDGFANSCEVLEIKFAQTIDYPHYFTPNGDGFNDYWNIRGLDGYPGTRIYIFDRYGKLLKQISASGRGWDGTYNGHLLPADDYWFTVDYAEPNSGQQQQFRAHFTLKR